MISILSCDKAENTNEETVFRLDGRLLDADRADVATWAEFFFNSNVYIVGFGLGEEELDIWWLLTYRAMLLKRANNYKIANKIVFYSVGEQDDPAYDSLERTLESLHVEIKHLTVLNGNWKEQYLSIVKDIKTCIE